MFSFLVLTFLTGYMIQPGDGTTTESMIQTTHSNHHHGHHPKPTHEPSELESFTFYYDYNTHIIAVKSSLHICYLYTTNGQEQMDVHTPHGLHTIERNLIAMIDAGSAMQPISRDDATTMGKALAHFCNHIQVFMKLN
ncbi:uncharacterized protein LOC125674041 isoform X2 [Ostrea edulis]|uniref:uncharacterized protein LOC125674041 isoform X2 n=1 Tax=Ostrea edulis TaxID=37623 RepID=UPI002095272A|nr:uncharacterized protein LOC125674041 isoform X2 [Ostrea edulis]